MKKFAMIFALVAAFTATEIATADTIDWKGITWTVNNASAIVNGDGSLTLTSSASSSSGVALHANRLSLGFDEVMDPWVQWSFSGHRADILIEQETPPGPTIQGGSHWDHTLAVTRYTLPDDSRSEDNYFIWAEDSEPISHVLSIGKRTDGTVDAKFDSDSWAATDFLKTNVGGNWGFNDVYLRMRDAGIDDTVTFNDFQYGSGHVPEPATMCMLGLGAFGLVRRKRKA